jgi:hypothetical protein
MKVSKRTVPLDILSFEHKEFRVSVMTQGQKYITVGVSKEGKYIHRQNFTPEQFINLLMRDSK